MTGVNKVVMTKQQKFLADVESMVDEELSNELLSKLKDEILKMANLRNIKSVKEETLEKCCAALFEKCRKNFSDNVYIFEAFVMQNIFTRPPPSSGSQSANSNGNEDGNESSSSGTKTDALTQLRDKHTVLNLEYLYMKAASEQKDALLQEVKDAADLTSRVQGIDHTRGDIASAIEDLVQLTKSARDISEQLQKSKSSKKRSIEEIVSGDASDLYVVNKFIRKVE